MNNPAPAGINIFSLTNRPGVTTTALTLNQRLFITGDWPGTCDRPLTPPTQGNINGTFEAKRIALVAGHTGCITIRARGTSQGNYSMAVYRPSFNSNNIKENLVAYAHNATNSEKDSIFLSFQAQQNSAYSIVVWSTLSGLTQASFALDVNDSQAKSSDFDGDGQTDSTVFRPSTGTWYILQSSTATVRVEFFGSNGDVPIDGDFDGDGKTDLSTFRPSTGAWYYRRSSNNTFFGTSFGLGTDAPVPGDYDSDGMTDVGIFRPSTGEWYISPASRAHSTYFAHTFGAPGDIPLGSQRK